MTPIRLSFAQVKLAARAAFLEGRLSCQDPDVTARECFYRSANGRPCVIGAALTDEQARICDGAADGSSIATLIEKGVVVSTDRDDLAKLQSTQDEACENDEAYLRLARLLDVPADRVPRRDPVTESQTRL